MEEVISRFPHIAEQIFEELDNYHFTQCKVISQSWKNLMEENKYSYIRLIKTITNCSKKTMKKIFPKANLEDVILLASDVSEVYDELNYEVDVTTDPSLTLFHTAAKHGYLSVCKLIIDGIEGKHPKNFVLKTPFHFAAENGHLSICQLIIENIENKNQPPVNNLQGFENIFDFALLNDTPIHMAAKNGHLSVCELIIKWIENAYPEKIKYANAANRHGSTPLHWAAEFGHLSVCQFLVEKVEDTNLENGLGATPLSCAVRNGHSAIFHLLFESIADKSSVNKGDSFGITPLHDAAENNLLSVCQTLMEIVDKGDPEDEDGSTPLHLAARNGHFEVCQLIVDNITKKNPKNFIGETPIQLASDAGHSTIVMMIQASLGKKIKLG
jgi:ankyrin repeat protein